MGVIADLSIVRFRLNGFSATDFAFPHTQKRSLVEAAGIEPASENLSAEHLHT
jgi:hypothetical protein